jgi:hypothetical protein
MLPVLVFLVQPVELAYQPPRAVLRHLPQGGAQGRQHRWVGTAAPVACHAAGLQRCCCLVAACFTSERVCMQAAPGAQQCAVSPLAAPSSRQLCQGLCTSYGRICHPCTAEIPWGDEIEHKVFKSSVGIGPYIEVAFFHRRTRTLLVTDAVVSVPETPSEVRHGCRYVAQAQLQAGRLGRAALAGGEWWRGAIPAVLGHPALSCMTAGQTSVEGGSCS